MTDQIPPGLDARADQIRAAWKDPANYDAEAVLVGALMHICEQLGVPGICVNYTDHSQCDCEHSHAELITVVPVPGPEGLGIVQLPAPKPPEENQQ